MNSATITAYRGWAENATLAQLFSARTDLQKRLKDWGKRTPSANVKLQRQLSIVWQEINHRTLEAKAKKVVEALRKKHGTKLFKFIKAEINSRL
jgi:hypothetical protein